MRARCRSFSNRVPWGARGRAGRRRACVRFRSRLCRAKRRTGVTIGAPRARVGRRWLRRRLGVCSRPASRALHTAGACQQMHAQEAVHAGASIRYTSGGRCP